MLLQTQYNLYKKFLYFLVFINLILLGSIAYFKISTYLIQKKINKESISINSLQQEIIDLKSNSSYKIYLAGSYISGKEKKVNYVALYKYLNQVKKIILKDLAGYNIVRFIFQVDPNQINIDTTLPAYNLVYMSGGLVDLLSKRDFVKTIKVNNFRKVPTGINVKLNLQTK